MNEVSCRAFETFFHALEVRGIPRERLVEGLPVRLSDLEDPGARVDWDLHVVLLERLAKLCGGEEALEEIGAGALDAAPLRAVRALSFFFASARHLYWMGCRWVGPSFFSHIQYGYRELDDDRVEVRVEIPEIYRGSRDFFVINAGTLRRTPHLLGLREDAEVEAQISSHRAVYLIRPPRAVSLLGLLRRMTKLPFAAWTAVEELADQQAGLNRALHQLHESGRRLENERDRIDIVEQMGRELLQQLEAERLPDQLLSFLRERFGWRGASLWLSSPEDERLVFYGRVGEVEGDATNSHDLKVSESSVGRLDVWEGERASEPADRDLLEKLLPWIALTVLNTRVAAAGRAVGSGAFRWASKSGEDLFMILDEAGSILYAGPGSDDLLGYDRDDFMQLDITDLIHPEDWPRVVGLFSSLAEHTSSALYSSVRLHHRDGSWRQLEGVAVKVMSEGGADVFLISAGQVRENLQRH